MTFFSSCFYLKFYNFSFLKDVTYLILERSERKDEAGRESTSEREILIGCLSNAPRLGTEPASQACALTEDQTSNLAFSGKIPNQLCHTGQGYNFSF